MDVATTNAVRKTLLEESMRGTSILLISEDLEEIFLLSDKIAVMYRGKIVGVFEKEKADLHTIGLLMAGEEIRGA